MSTYLARRFALERYGMLQVARRHPSMFRRLFL